MTTFTFAYGQAVCAVPSVMRRDHIDLKVLGASGEGARASIPADKAPAIAAAILRAAGLDAIADCVAVKPRDLTPYRSACPEGYDTVLHWLMRQGDEPEDMGRKVGLYLWRITKPGGRRDDAVAVKVRAPAALTEVDVCEWVLAYPVDFLAEYLGPVDEAA
jgi:hypothetical protein